MKRLITLILLGLLVISTVGCSKNVVAQKTTPRYLRIAQNVDLVSIDKDVAMDSLSFEIISDANEGLYTKDSEAKLVPALATEHSVSEDGLTYTFKLRDAKWSNGDKITANDFVFSWRRLVDPATASEYSFIAQVAGIKNAEAITSKKKQKEELGVSAKDDQTLVVELERPVPYFLSLTAFPTFVPLNEKFVKAQGANYGLDAANVLASGPFKLTSWKKGYGFVLDKNPNYYNAENIKLDGLDYRVIKDNQTAALKFESNELDIVKISAELVDRYKDNEAFTQVKGSMIYYATMNAKNEVFKNVNVRKALQHAINKQSIVDTILNDGSIVADFIIPVGLGNGPDGKDFRSSATDKYGKYDVALAKKYWDTAKTELGKDVVEVELLFDDDETIKKTAEFIQAELETNLEGIKVVLKSQPKKNRLELMGKGDYEVGLTRWGPDYDDPLTYFELFLTGASYNYPGYSNPEYDKLVKSSSTNLATDAKGRWDAMIKAEKILLDEDAVIEPIYQQGSTYLINKKITKLGLPTPSTQFIYKDVVIEK